MNTASLELCKKLHALSGWGDTHEYYGRMESGRYIATCGLFEKHQDCPAYDLGYLLRKLRAGTAANIDEIFLMERDGRGWMAELKSLSTRVVEDADTPEDAACKLCVGLIKQGVIKP